MKIPFEKIVEIARALYPYKTVKNHHCSFVIQRGRIISIGQNSHKTNPKNLMFPKTNKYGVDISPYRGTCSEWNALKKVEKQKNLVLINIRLDNNNLSINYSYPCESCRNLIRYFDINEIYYTNTEGAFVKI
jgi:deoxycytidylate deaminase